MSPLKSLERLGRRLIVYFVGLVLGVRQRPVRLPAAPKILVVRLDERVGNLLLLVPVLDTLRRRFPYGTIELLGSVKGAALLHHHPCLDALLTFEKRALFAACGPLRMPWRLRRRGYDVAIDAANPTDPSTTQAILTRLCGAKHTVGVEHPGFGRLFSSRVRISAPEAHEIDLRLQLLSPLPGALLSRRVFLGPPRAVPKSSPTHRLLERSGELLILNVGARTKQKRLSVKTYARIARCIHAAGRDCVLTYGPKEAELASLVSDEVPEAVLAPPTTLDELRALMAAAEGVVTCDTGPMHLGVAVATPTCGIFVSTAPSRYGYSEAPHACIDARHEPPDAWLPLLEDWLRTLSSRRPLPRASPMECRSPS